jgi:FAD/FMN-containing dehydrogenase
MFRRAFAQSAIFRRIPLQLRWGSAKAERDDRFAKLQNEDVDFFKQILPTGVVTDSDQLERYNADWLNQWHGNSQVVLKPSTTQQVSHILSYCNSRRLAVCPQGGNTGLVGGSVPVHDEIIVSLERMRNVIEFDEVSGAITCEAGCVLENLDTYLNERGFAMPLDLGAKGTCQIGGNVATNAGGLRFLRYGSLHQNVLGLKAVLPCGTVIDHMNRLKKDNTGYDLKQLFIGSEGTLGIITELCLQVPVKPLSVSVALLACPSFADVQKTFVMAKQHCSEILSACEFMDARSVQSFIEVTGKTFPIDPDHQFYMVVETHGSNGDHDEEKLNGFLETVMGEGCVVDGTIAQSGKDMAEIWECREGISPAMSSKGYTYKYDISLPVPRMYDLVEDMRARFADTGRDDVLTHGFGHLGDGNVHMNITSTKGFDPDVEAIIEPFVYEWTQKNRGSISAEHGIGQMKRDVLHMTKSETCVGLMRQLKTLMDPNGILNPYKVVPE